MLKFLLIKVNKKILSIILKNGFFKTIKLFFSNLKSYLVN